MDTLDTLKHIANDTVYNTIFLLKNNSKKYSTYITFVLVLFILLQLSIYFLIHKNKHPKEPRTLGQKMGQLFVNQFDFFREYIHNVIIFVVDIFYSSIIHFCIVLFKTLYSIFSRMVGEIEELPTRMSNILSAFSRNNRILKSIVGVAKSMVNEIIKNARLIFQKTIDTVLKIVENYIPFGKLTVALVKYVIDARNKVRQTYRSILDTIANIPLNVFIIGLILILATPSLFALFVILGIGVLVMISPIITFIGLLASRNEMTLPTDNRNVSMFRKLIYQSVMHFTEMDDKHNFANIIRNLPFKLNYFKKKTTTEIHGGHDFSGTQPNVQMEGAYLPKWMLKEFEEKGEGVLNELNEGMHRAKRGQLIKGLIHYQIFILTIFIVLFIIYRLSKQEEIKESSFATSLKNKKNELIETLLSLKKSIDDILETFFNLFDNLVQLAGQYFELLGIKIDVKDFSIRNIIETLKDISSQKDNASLQLGIIDLSKLLDKKESEINALFNPDKITDYTLPALNEIKIKLPRVRGNFSFGIDVSDYIKKSVLPKRVPGVGGILKRFRRILTRQVTNLIKRFIRDYVGLINPMLEQAEIILNALVLKFINPSTYQISNTILAFMVYFLKAILRYGSGFILFVIYFIRIVLYTFQTLDMNKVITFIVYNTDRYIIKMDSMPETMGILAVLCIFIGLFIISSVVNTFKLATNQLSVVLFTMIQHLPYMTQLTIATPLPTIFTLVLIALMWLMVYSPQTLSIKKIFK